VKGTKTDRQERRERIKESRQNREYEWCMTEEIQEYLPGNRECKRKKNDGEL
jgi:adenosyl cobinamide kinase/adenosyl cobinamide phosphate guanylyltransferase